MPVKLATTERRGKAPGLWRHDNSLLQKECAVESRDPHPIRDRGSRHEPAAARSGDVDAARQFLAGIRRRHEARIEHAARSDRHEDGIAAFRLSGGAHGDRARNTICATRAANVHVFDCC